VGLTHRVDADSDSREYIPTADSPFYRFSNPPRSACRFTCVSALYRCVCLRSLWDLSGNVFLGVVSSSEALRVVLRGFVILPLFVQGQHYAVYLFFTTGGGGSVSLITERSVGSEGGEGPREKG
jgi:hypothetical protein